MQTVDMLRGASPAAAAPLGVAADGTPLLQDRLQAQLVAEAQARQDQVWAPLPPPSPHTHTTILFRVRVSLHRLGEGAECVNASSDHCSTLIPGLYGNAQAPESDVIITHGQNTLSHELGFEPYIQHEVARANPGLRFALRSRGVRISNHLRLVGGGGMGCCTECRAKVTNACLRRTLTPGPVPATCAACPALRLPVATGISANTAFRSEAA